MYENLKEDQKKLFIKCLQRMATLSALFNEGNIPYLDYRVHENSFCFSFGAQNAGRADVSVDAILNGIGVGLKTFLHSNGKTLQKIAEFNADLPEILDAENDVEIIRNVSLLRNRRVEFTRDLYDLNEMIYHLCTRVAGELFIYEDKMALVNIESIRNVQRRRNVITFNDGLSDYSFNIGKSTLFKRFVLNKPLDTIPVNRLSDPFDFLLNIPGIGIEDLLEQPTMDIAGRDFIILPLYSTRTGDPAPGSGLNQWNAGGRERDQYECYIPVPSKVKECCPDFFVLDVEHTFDVYLPNNNIINCKLCQQGLKALMSNPNNALGEWLLRDLLRVQPLEVVTRDFLEKVGTDCVKITKISDVIYKIDFEAVGAYEEFIQNL